MFQGGEEGEMEEGDEDDDDDDEFVSLSDGSGGAAEPLSLQDLQGMLTALQYRRSVHTQINTSKFTEAFLAELKFIA